MALSQQISFIGGGNMAGALIQGLIAAGTALPEQITACDVREEALAALRKQHGVRTTSDSAQACQADVVVLSVKPQVFASLLPAIAPQLGASTLVISIAAGVPLAAIEARLGAQARVVRAMPNTPALVGAGATALAAGTRATPADTAVAEQIFQSVGISVRVPEELMDAVTALSGSGPAYVFLMAEVLTEAGVRLGLSEAAASQLASQTVYGSGKLLHGSSEPPAELRRKVTSPGGTTQAGLARMEELGLRNAVLAGVEAARDRGRELGREAAAKLAGS